MPSTLWTVNLVGKRDSGAKLASDIFVLSPERSMWLSKAFEGLDLPERFVVSRKSIGTDETVVANYPANGLIHTHSQPLMNVKDQKLHGCLGRRFPLVRTPSDSRLKNAAQKRKNSSNNVSPRKTESRNNNFYDVLLRHPTSNKSAMISLVQKIGNPRDANFPRDGEGRVYHLGVKAGEVANRVLSVGDPNRAAIIASMLDNPERNFIRASNRGFTVHTGKFRGVEVSIIATGMGFPMMDFVIRETRAIVEGPMALMRFGTCGTPNKEVKIGTVTICSKGSVMIIRDPDAFRDTTQTDRSPFMVTKRIYPDEKFTQLLVDSIKNTSPETMVREGINATADSFYSSQGRVSSNFDDKNQTLIDDLMEAYPELQSLEMETFHLLDLADNSNPSMIATACALVLAQRHSNDFLDNATKEAMEKTIGLACLSALAEVPLPDL